MSEDDKLRMELACCTQTLLGEIAMPEMKRNDVAKTYALALRSSEETDWSAVNRAIIERWSMHALTWIKTRAWSGRCFDA